MVVGFKEGNQFRLGDRVSVKIAKVDLQNRQMWVDFVKKLGSAKLSSFNASRAGSGLTTSQRDPGKRRKRDKPEKKKGKRSRRGL
jgi:ribonuclease R